MTAAKKLAYTVYATDPDGGGTVTLTADTKASAIPERIRETLGEHVWQDDPDEVEPDAPAPPGGVTGQDPASVDRDGDGIEDGPDGATLIDGNKDEVLERVGGNPALAQAALDAENAKDKPRKGVVERLQAVAGQG